MSRIVTVASHKGGVGKTTTVLNLGHALAGLGKKVRLVDADPQGGLGHASNLKARAAAGLVAALRGEAGVDEVVAVTRDPFLSVVGTGVGGPDDVGFLEAQAREGGLGDLLRRLAEGQDVVLVDAPAGTGGVLHGLLCASHGLVGVTAARALSVRGLPSLLQAFEAARRSNAALQFDGLLLAGYDVLQQPESVLKAQLMKELPPGALFSTVIPWVPAVEVASQRCVPAALVPGAQRVAAAYAQLASEWAGRQRGGAPRGDQDVYGLF